MILCWALKMWSVMYVNEWQETSNMAGNWHRQWTTTELVQCPPPLPWPGSCQRWHVLTTNFCTSMSDRDHMRERMLKAFSQNTLCHTDQDFFCIYNKCTGLEELHYFALKTVLNFFFTPLCICNPCVMHSAADVLHCSNQTKVWNEG